MFKTNRIFQFLNLDISQHCCLLRFRDDDSKRINPNCIYHRLYIGKKLISLEDCDT